MKTSHLALSLIISISCLFLSCSGDKSGSTSTNDTAEKPPKKVAEKPSEEVTKERIVDILSNYYTDLASEKLDEDKYFAPELDQFFGSRSISREKVGQSLRNGFEAVEDRHITFDPKTLRIRPTSDGYESTFKGQSIHTRTSDGQQISASFNNKVSFNKDFQIVAYGGADDKAAQNTRSLGPAKTTAPSAITATEAMAKTVLTEFEAGKFSKCKSFIHPKYGFYLVGQPGAYSVPYHLTSFDEIFKKAPWLSKGTEMYTDLKAEAIPTFTCEGDKYFDKDGSFIADVNSYAQLSSLMKALRQAEFEEFGPEVVRKAAQLEKLIKVEVVETKSGIAYYYGQDAGKWYLFIIDMARYGCSA